MEYRRNEDPRTWFRSNRIFRSDGRWYFHTREGIPVGPYSTQFEAEIDVGLLKSLLNNAESERAIAIIREFMLDSGSTMGGLNTATFTDYLIDEGDDLPLAQTA